MRLIIGTAAVSGLVLAHPEDDRTSGVFDPGMRGSTDRAVLVFRKPM